MSLTECGQPVIDLVPHLVGGDNTQLIAWHLHREVDWAPMARIDDRERRRLSFGQVPPEKPRNILYGTHCRREIDTLRACIA